MCSYKAKDLLFNEKAKEVVRKPLGIAIFKEADVAVKHVEVLIEDYKPPLIATIGDVVTLNFVRHGRVPEIALVDFKTKRKRLEDAEVNEILSSYNVRLLIKNPRSTIVKESWNVLTKAVSRVIERKVKCLVIVDGEEDLLTLPLLIIAPERSFVLYGQPDQALVLVIVNEYVRSAFSKFLCKLVKQL